MLSWPLLLGSGFLCLPAVLAVLLAGTGLHRHRRRGPRQVCRREEKTFSTSGKADVSVGTFDGSIEVRPWDRPEVQVIIEKRARDKAAADEIDASAPSRTAIRIIVDVKPRKGSEHRGMNFGWNMSRVGEAHRLDAGGVRPQREERRRSRSTSSASPGA